MNPSTTHVSYHADLVSQSIYSHRPVAGIPPYIYQESEELNPDMLTKALAPAKLEYHRNNYGITQRI